MFPSRGLCSDIGFEDVPGFGKKEAAFLELSFDHGQKVFEMRIGAPKIADLRVAEFVDLGFGEDFFGGGFGDF